MNFKSTIAAVAASPFLLAGAAFAGPYVNVETVSSYSGDDYTGLSTEFQIGYEGENWYVSGGPIVDSPDNGESSTDFIGYVGGSLDLLIQSVHTVKYLFLQTRLPTMHTVLKLVLSIHSRSHISRLLTST